MSLRLLGAAAAILLGLIFFMGRHDQTRAADFPRPLATAQGGHVLELEVDDLYDRGVALDSLAEPGVYTVVAFTGRTCGLAHALEGRMPAFLALRQDVVFKNVHLSGGGVKVFHDRKAQRAWVARQDGIREKYLLDFAPKVFVFGPDRQALVGTQHRGDYGYRFMMAWTQAPGTGPRPGI